MQYKNLTTPALIDKCVSKNSLAWAEFVRRFSPLIIFAVKKSLAQYASGSLSTNAETDDIAQNMLMSFWRKNTLANVKNKDSINYWLVIAARHSVINHVKSRKKELLIADQSYFEKLPAKEKENASFEERESEIKKVYVTLSSREKLIFKLYFKKGLGLKDISKIIKVPIGTVSSIITRMRKKF